MKWPKVEYFRVRKDPKLPWHRMVGEVKVLDEGTDHPGEIHFVAYCGEAAPIRLAEKGTVGSTFQGRECRNCERMAEKVK